MVASYSGHYECVRELIMQGADINLQREALLPCSLQHNKDMTKSLSSYLSLEPPLNSRPRMVVRPCLQPARVGTPKWWTLCSRTEPTSMTSSVQWDSSPIPLQDGATPLFLASQEGHLTVVRQLLSSGAKVNQPREDGTAPLWMAAQMGHNEVVKVLLLRGADRDADRTDGSTALFKAAHKGHCTVIEELLKFNPSLGLLKNGSTALHAAVMGGNPKTVKLLLGANADPTLRNKNNDLPADLTKNERILRILRPQILNGES
ncbi:ankyrin repeat domain-containing protein 29 isoform X3 [Salminus brasiliensis]